jgi:hypothetical protein
MEDDLKFLLSMEDDLKQFCKWKTTSNLQQFLFCKWK